MKHQNTNEYLHNINAPIGKIKNQLLRPLTDNQKQIQQAIHEIIQTISKKLVITKISIPTNEEKTKNNTGTKTANKQSEGI